MLQLVGDEVAPTLSEFGSVENETCNLDGATSRAGVDTRKAGQDFAHLYVFTAEKGGMKGCDQELQRQVIFELSQGSKHFQHARQQDAKLDQRISQILEAIRSAPLGRRDALDRQALQICQTAESKRDWSRWCCVVDMDMFYAAVEIRDQPVLAELPVAVGGLGMICTANYVARRYGVRSAMPGFIAQELCRRQGVELRFVRPDFTKYTAEAECIREVIADYGPYSAFSLDEAYIDITDRVRDRASEIAQSAGPRLAQDGHSSFEEQAAHELVKDMRSKIQQKTRGLTASAGIAPSFALAKLASDENKPDGQFMVPRARESLLQWLQPKPLRKLGGVGKVTDKMLHALGAECIGDVVRLKADVLAAMPGVRSEWLLERALGVASNSLDVHEAGDGAVHRKSISNERTFRDESNADTLLRMLKEQCVELSAEMAKESLAGKTVTVKLKHTSFTVVTRAHSCKSWVSSAEELWVVARDVLRREFPCTLRLLGVRVSNFRNGHGSGNGSDDRQQPKLAHFFQAGQRKQPQPSTAEVGLSDVADFWTVPCFMIDEDADALDETCSDLQSVSSGRMLDVVIARGSSSASSEAALAATAFEPQPHCVNAAGSGVAVFPVSAEGCILRAEASDRPPPAGQFALLAGSSASSADAVAVATQTGGSSRSRSPKPKRSTISDLLKMASEKRPSVARVASSRDGTEDWRLPVVVDLC